MLAINTRKILKTHQLKATSGRIAVLELFLTSTKAISHSDIEENLLNQTVDRVTIYRILDCFVHHNIIHKVISEQSVQLFALSQHSNDETHSGQHAHLICNSCDSVECIDLPLEIGTAQVIQKIGHSISSINITLHGLCSHCEN